MVLLAASAAAGCNGLAPERDVRLVLVLDEMTIDATEEDAALRLDEYPHCEGANYVDQQGQRRLVLWDHDGPAPGAVVLHRLAGARTPGHVDAHVGNPQRHALLDGGAGTVPLASLADPTVHLLDVELLPDGSVRVDNQTLPPGAASAPVETERVLHRGNVTFTVRETLTVSNLGRVPLETPRRAGCD